MKKLLLLVIISTASTLSFGQMVMSAKGINPDNVCKPNTVYFLMEDKPKPLESIDSIELKLNTFVKYAKENPSFEAKPAVQFAVNCKGEVGGGFHIVTKSGNETLDNELLEFFKTIKSWQAGKIKKKYVDSWYMWRMEIKNGNIDILNK